MRRAMLVGLALVTGCFEGTADGQGDSFQDDDPPIGCETGTGGCQGQDDASDDDDDDDADEGSDEAPLSPVGGPCDDTTQCVDGASCGASFEDGDPGPLECRATCIVLDDESAWCTDDASCCVGSCSARGLCIQPGADATDDGTTAADDTSGDGDDTTGSDGTAG